MMKRGAHQENEKNVREIVTKSSLLFLCIVGCLAGYHHTQRNQTFKPFVDTSSFYPESNPKIYAGEIHYARIPVEYWEHRILMIKAMGLNSLSVYIMWNYHEIERGEFDFATGNKNLPLFLELAEKHNMTVLIRPGPYVCAEWDFGGLPSRLLSIEGLKIRTNDPLFIKEVEVYFRAVAPIIKQHLWSPERSKNCIIMLQIENQYGFYGTDVNYIASLRQIWRDLDVHTAEYYVDWFINIRKSHWYGANIGLNDAFSEVEFDYIRSTLEPRGMVFGGQIYSGWLTWWHRPNFQKRDANEKAKQYEFLMSHNFSFAMYMAHGGTSFGLTAGANSAFLQQFGFGGSLTSYDYDAPINQQGSATVKYGVFRELITKYADWMVPEVPPPIPIIKIASFQPRVVANVFANIKWSSPNVVSKKLLPFESTQLKMFNLGLVVYQTTLPANSKATYMIKANDLGYVTLDEKFITLLDRTIRKHHKLELKCDSSSPCQLRILIEAMGHINFDISMQDDYKGLRQFYNIEHEAKSEEFEWKIYTLPIDEQILNMSATANMSQNNSAVLLKGTFSLEKVGDTYLNMSQYSKGYVWANGHNLGRYWKVGPQFKLFCPGVWLKEGANELYILELMYDGEHPVRGEETLNELQL